MSDDPNVKHSHPVDEKEPSLKAKEGGANPKKHGADLAESDQSGSEAGGEPGEGRTGTGLGSTDS